MPEKQKTHVLNYDYANQKPSFSFSIIVCVTHLTIFDFRYEVKCMNLGNFLVGIWDIFSPDHPGTYIYIFMLSSLFFSSSRIFHSPLDDSILLLYSIYLCLWPIQTIRPDLHGVLRIPKYKKTNAD